MVVGYLANPTILQRVNYYPRLRKLISYMNDHAAEPLSLAAAAAIVCMERTAFSRFFSRNIGITFHEFVQHWRIANAIQKMVASDCSFAELAYSVGFENINTFGRAFKKVTTITPSQYRRHLRINGRDRPINGEKLSIFAGNQPTGWLSKPLRID